LGVRLSADSSKKTRQACAVGRLLDPRPVARDPLVDRRLVALGSPACRALHRPAQPVAQQRPDVGGMVAHAGQPLDDQRDAVNGPQLPDEPVGARAVQQALLDGGELRIRQPRRGAARALAAQGLRPAGLEAAMPDADGLGGDSKLAGDLGWRTPAANSSAARSRRAWSRSRSRCAAGRRGMVGMPAILTRRAAQHHLDPGTPQPDTQDPSFGVGGRV
jgi:hypothetical protein